MIRAFIEKCAAKMTDDCSEPVLLSDENSDANKLNPRFSTSGTELQSR